MFTEPLLDILPAPVAAKLRRLQAAPDAATEALLARAARWLDLHGAHTRFVTHGIKPARVVPALPGQVGNPVAAVEDARQRLAAIDAYAARLDDAVAAGGLLPAWRDVLATDASLARLAWERIEEAVICEAADAGIRITRRADMDPAALLQIERA